jgi:hypothetical protein
MRTSNLTSALGGIGYSWPIYPQEITQHHLQKAKFGPGSVRTGAGYFASTGIRFQTVKPIESAIQIELFRPIPCEMEW